MSITLNRNNRVRNAAKWIVILLVFITAFFANRTYQGKLGKQALSAIEFEIFDLADARVKAKIENKLILANLSAIHCSICRKLDSQVFADIQVKKRIERDYIYARVDYQSEQGKTFMLDYRVSGFPVLLVLDENGHKLTRLPLTFSAQEFATNLNLVAAVYSEELAANSDSAGN